jgi:hypothetical protein
MRSGPALVGAAIFARRYLVTAACVGAFACAMVRAAASGVGPVPQEPPDGYSLLSGRISLEWNRGDRPGPIALEVSEEDPSFSKPIYGKVATGTTFTLTTVRPGKKYFWRLVQGGAPSPVATFEVSPDYADF